MNEVVQRTVVFFACAYCMFVWWGKIRAGSAGCYDVDAAHAAETLLPVSTLLFFTEYQACKASGSQTLKTEHWDDQGSQSHKRITQGRWWSFRCSQLYSATICFLFSTSSEESRLVTLSGCSLLLQIDTVAWYGLIVEADLYIFKLGAVF